MFTRTRSGLNNQHVFFRVDYILYTEGGKISYKPEEVIAGTYTDHTDDIVFWSNIFKTVEPSIKIKYKSIGSKENVKFIANKIISEDLNRIIAAMDSEHDQVLSYTLSHRNILYTHGYSWENDIWEADLIKDVVFTISAFEAEDNDLQTNFDSLIKDLEHLVYADVLLFTQSKSFFPRKTGTLSFVNCKPEYLPNLMKDRVLEVLKEKSIDIKEVEDYGRELGIIPQRNCYGHFLADYCYQMIINYIGKRYNQKGVSRL